MHHSSPVHHHTGPAARCGAVKAGLFLSGLPAQGFSVLLLTGPSWPSALRTDNKSGHSKTFSSRPVLKTWVDVKFPHEANLKWLWVLLWQTPSVNYPINVLQFRKALGCILISNSVTSSDWLPEGEGAFCLQPAGLKIPLPGRSEQNVVSNATDKWFFTICDDNSHDKGLPAYKEAQGVDGHIAWVKVNSPLHMVLIVHFPKG